MPNPIPFNPATMTASQLFECAETLRTLFNMVERDASAEQLEGYVLQARDFMAEKLSNKKS